MHEPSITNEDSRTCEAVIQSRALPRAEGKSELQIAAWDRRLRETLRSRVLDLGAPPDGDTLHLTTRRYVTRLARTSEPCRVQVSTVTRCQEVLRWPSLLARTPEVHYRHQGVGRCQPFGSTTAEEPTAPGCIAGIAGVVTMASGIHVSPTGQYDRWIGPHATVGRAAVTVHGSPTEDLRDLRDLRMILRTRTGRAYGCLSSPSRSNSTHQATLSGRSEIWTTISPGVNTAIRSPRTCAQSLSPVT